MSSHILVIGATGMIGQELVRRLVEKEQNITALVRPERDTTKLRKLGAQVAYGDLNDVHSIKQAMNPNDKVFFLPPFVPNMVELSKQFIKAAVERNVSSIVKLSSVRVELDTMKFIIGNWHREIEQKIEQSDIPYTFLRASTFMQNLIQSSATTIRQSGTFYIPMGNAKEVFIDTRDIANVACHVLMEDSNQYINKKITLTGPEALSYSEISKILSSVLDRSIQYINISPEATRKSLLELGMPPLLVQALLQNYEVIKNGTYGYQPQVSDAVETITGKPATPFETFIRDHQSIFEN